MPRTMDIRDKVERLRRFVSDKHRMPVYSEMLSIFGYKSKDGVFKLIRKLEENGFITKTRGKIAFTGKLIGSVKLLGTVQAGFPSPAEEELVDAISMDEYLIRRPEATYMLTVEGDSMSEAGILPGDIVLVEKGVKPKPNDIVVAKVDDAWTLKY